MTRRRWAALATLTLLAASPTPRRTPPPPVFELHRNAAAVHADPVSVNPLFVLVIGSDLREGFVTGRADSIHLVAVNSQTLRGTVLGFPRDAWVNVPGRGTTKINEALTVGGPQKVVETVSALTGIPIHYHAMVDFGRFTQLVDRLGGVTVDVPYPMNDKASGAVFAPGPRQMNGPEALAFARNRHDAPGGDLGRSENHGRLLLAGLVKFRTEARDPFALLRHLEAFRDLVVTDVGARDLLALGRLGLRLDPGNLRNVVVPARPGMVGAQSVVFLQPGGLYQNVRDDGTI